MEAGQPDTAKSKTESTAKGGDLIPPATSSPGQQELMMTKMVHLFGGDATTAERSKELLGGKGSNLAELASIGLPVPPGFKINTHAGATYVNQRNHEPNGRREA